MGKSIVVLSDLHCGSTVGLWPGEHEVEGGGTYTANKFGQWLYQCWGHCVEQVRAMDRPIVVLNGDLVQGVSPKDGMLITNLVSIQARAAEALLLPLVEHASRLFVIRGTEWHEGKSAEHVERLAEALGAEREASTGQFSRWELYLRMGDDVIHFAHHVGVSSVPWYEATVPLRDTLMQLAELSRFYGERAPNVRMVVRSHRHRYVHVEVPPDIQVVVSPAWQLKTAFAHKKAASMLPQVGYVTITQTDNGLQVGRCIYPLPPLSVEVVE